MNVIKSDGTTEQFSMQKIEDKYNVLIEKKLKKELPFANIKGNIKGYIVEGISTKDINKIIIKSALDLISISEPNWQIVASRFYMDNLYNEVATTTGCQVDELYNGEYFYALMQEYIQNGNYFNFNSKYTKDEIIFFGEKIDKTIDCGYNYNTVILYDKRYLKNPNKIKKELPQHMYMAIAMYLGMNEPANNRVNFVLDAYRYCASGAISLPTPTLLNARTTFGQLSSCFKFNVDDDLRGIYHSVENMAQVSKFGGGIGVYLGNIRSKGAKIRGEKGMSGGVNPWVKVINDTAIAVNQLGARAGAISVTLDVWHSDIYDFLDLQTETGDIRRKAYDIFPAISIPDIFMERVSNDQMFTLFDPKDVFDITGVKMQDLYGDAFSSFYTECENNPLLEKEAVNAKELFKKFLKTTIETGMPYVFFRDTVNNVNPNKHAGMIYNTNLCCVSGDTKILTENGYENIVDASRRESVMIWNGEEYSETNVIETGRDRELVEVKVSTGKSIKCTKNHRFYIKNNYFKKEEMVEASELKRGDKLIRYSLPIIEGFIGLKYAYENGFYTGDGTTLKNGTKRLYFYGEKKKLITHIKCPGKIRESKSSDRIEFETTRLQNKFFVPSPMYRISSRLEWLAGYADADGTITNNNGSESLQITCINLEFLNELQLMLQTLGVDSRINKGSKAGLYNCKQVYRLLINGNGLYQLSELGFTTHRLKFSKRKPNRVCSEFAKVTSIKDVEGLHTTYCFNEPKRHMGMFNGILTGQCEIQQNTSAPEFVAETTEGGDVLIRYKVGESVTCNLASINLAHPLLVDEQENIVKITARLLDNVIDLNYYPIEETRLTAMKYRPIGIGFLGLAERLALSHVKYSEAHMDVDIIFREITAQILRASVELAKERGAYPLFNGSEWSKGIMNGVQISELLRDGELEKDMKEYGTRFGYHIAPAPNTSTSIVVGTTASVLPIYKKYFVETGSVSPTINIAPKLDSKNFWFYQEYTKMNMLDVISIIEIIYKYIDQSISFEFMVDPKTVSPADLYKYYFTSWRAGIKTVYYVRSLSLEVTSSCESCSG